MVSLHLTVLVLLSLGLLPLCFPSSTQSIALSILLWEHARSGISIRIGLSFGLIIETLCGLSNGKNQSRMAVVANQVRYGSGSKGGY